MVMLIAMLSTGQTTCNNSSLLPLHSCHNNVASFHLANVMAFGRRAFKKIEKNYTGYYTAIGAEERRKTSKIDDNIFCISIFFPSSASDVILYHFLYFSISWLPLLLNGIWTFGIRFFIAFIFIFIFAKDYCVGSLYYWIIAHHFSSSLLFFVCSFVCLHKNRIINTSWIRERKRTKTRIFYAIRWPDESFQNEQIKT